MRETLPSPDKQPLAMQIVRLLAACGDRFDPLFESEPLIVQMRERYGELRSQTDFTTASILARSEMVEAFMRRGTPLVEGPTEEEP